MMKNWGKSMPLGVGEVCSKQLSRWYTPSNLPSPLLCQGETSEPATLYRNVHHITNNSLTHVSRKLSAIESPFSENVAAPEARPCWFYFASKCTNCRVLDECKEIPIKYSVLRYGNILPWVFPHMQLRHVLEWWSLGVWTLRKNISANEWEGRMFIFMWTVPPFMSISTQLAL
jgi:hypothetical protein